MSGFRCLALETGVRPSSVAACNGEREFEALVPEGAKIAATLYGTIDEVLGEVDLALEDLDCIAFGRGPGAFTGLRVAAAAAQGLATGLGIRVCAVSSLAALAQDATWGGGRPALREAGDGLPPGDDCAPAGTWVAPALPAGRGEVFLGWYRIGESGLVSAGAERLACAGGPAPLAGNRTIRRLSRRSLVRRRGAGRRQRRQDGAACGRRRSLRPRGTSPRRAGLRARPPAETGGRPPRISAQRAWGH